MLLPTYTARYHNPDGTYHTIYTRQPRGNLVGPLPYGSFPVAHEHSTLERSDGGDAFEFAVFKTSPGGRLIEITRDDEPQPLRIVLAHDLVNGTFKVMSNCQNLPLEVLDVSNPDPDNTEAAEARVAESTLYLIHEEYGN